MIGVDWGTSHLRAARLDGAGKVLEERTAAHGVLSVAPGQFAAVLEALVGDWTNQGAQTSGGLILISGMAGSKQGWVEAPYCVCPAGFAEVAAQLHWIPPQPEPHFSGSRIAIVPGLSCEHPHAPDVMRGEEVQIFGALELLGLADALLVLPGTHSKWARVQARRVVSFQSFMTGEVYALLSQHSILSKTIDTAAPLDEAAFLQGVDQAMATGSLLHNAFSTRTLSLFARCSPGELASRLSGLVIGEELKANPVPRGDEVVLIGSAVLTARYTLALAHLGVQSRRLGSESTWAGLHALAQTLPR